MTFLKGCIPWNKGLKISELYPHLTLKLKGRKTWSTGKKIKDSHPQIGYKKGHSHWDNEKTRAAWIKDGTRLSPSTQFALGKKPWNWKVDRLSLKKDRRHAYDSVYKDWALRVKKRDGWKCRISNNDCSKRLEAHHILNWQDYPELRYDIKNGITLCRAHHPIKRAEEKRLAPYFQELVAVLGD